MASRRNASILLFTFFCGTYSSFSLAQDSQHDLSKATFTASTQLVQVPVLVRRGDAHVSGLKKEDFSVLQDGEGQPIAIFQEIIAQGGRFEKSAEAGEFSNVLAEQASNPIIVIAIDTVNTPVLQQTHFRDELIKFLNEAAASREPFALVILTRTGLHVLYDFITDPRVLSLALQKYQGKHPEFVSKTPDTDNSVPIQTRDQEQADRFAHELADIKDSEQQIELFQNRRSRIDTLAALQQLAQALAGFPGRKTVLWASSGFPLAGGVFETSRGTDVVMRARNASEALDQAAYTWRLLNAANVSIYPIDLRGNVNTAYDFMSPDHKYSATVAQKEMPRAENQEIISTFQNVALATGGKACFGREDFHNCIREAVDDSKDYYLLGFYVDKRKTSPGWHKLTVKVNTKGNVRARNGYLLGDQDPSAGKVTDFQLALASPMNYTALPFHGRFTQIARAGDKTIVGYELRLSGDSVTIDQTNKNHLSLDIVALARNRDGSEAGKKGDKVDKNLPEDAVTVIRNEGIVYKNKVELAVSNTGDYGIWFVVRDNVTGRTGSVMVPLRVAQ